VTKFRNVPLLPDFFVVEKQILVVMIIVKRNHTKFPFWWSGLLKSHVERQVVLGKQTKDPTYDSKKELWRKNCVYNFILFVSGILDNITRFLMISHWLNYPCFRFTEQILCCLGITALLRRGYKNLLERALSIFENIVYASVLVDKPRLMLFIRYKDFFL